MEGNFSKICETKGKSKHDFLRYRARLDTFVVSYSGRLLNCHAFMVIRDVLPKGE